LNENDYYLLRRRDQIHSNGEIRWEHISVDANFVAHNHRRVKATPSHSKHYTVEQENGK
jgi:hypothetical protein